MFIKVCWERVIHQTHSQLSEKIIFRVAKRHQRTNHQLLTQLNRLLSALRFLTFQFIIHQTILGGWISLDFHGCFVEQRVSPETRLIRPNKSTNKTAYYHILSFSCSLPTINKVIITVIKQDRGGRRLSHPEARSSRGYSKLRHELANSLTARRYRTRPPPLSSKVNSYDVDRTT